MSKKNASKKQKPAAKPAAGKSASEFRFLKVPRDIEERHPRHIYKKKGTDAYALVITHDKHNSNKTKPLLMNPNPKDDRPAKVKKKAEIRPLSQFAERQKGWSIRCKQDKETITALIKENNARSSTKLQSAKKSAKKKKGG